jgi:hypothetical protein
MMPSWGYMVTHGACPGAAADANNRGFFGQGDMQKEFEEASFALKPGEISPVIETASGLHLIERYVAFNSCIFGLHAFHIPRCAGSGSSWHGMRASVFMTNDCCTDTSLCFQTRVIANFASLARQRMSAFFLTGHLLG